MKTKPQPVQGQAGDHISKFCKDLYAKRHSILYATAKNGQDFEAEFNGAIITVTASATPESLEAAFMVAMDKNAEAYRNSDEYKQQQAKSQSEGHKRVAEWKNLMTKLLTLNFLDHKAVLTWLYNYCESIDYIPALELEPKMVESRIKVAAALMEGGYGVNVNTGEDFKSDDEDNHARYLIGQVLTFLTKNSPVPQIFGSMYEDYMKKFK